MKRIISISMWAIFAGLLACQSVNSPSLPLPAISIHDTATVTLANPTSPSPIQTASTPSTATAASLDNIEMFSESTGWGILDAPQRIAHSSDGGRTWLSVPIPFESHFFLDQQTAWLVTEPGMLNPQDTEVIYHTNDGGRTWTKIPTPFRQHTSLQFKTEKLGWAVANVDVAAGNLYFELYQTMDGGQHWTQMLFSDPRGYPHESSLPAGAFHASEGEGFEFLDPSTFWFGGNQLAARTTISYYFTHNAGKSWVEKQIAVPEEHQILWNMVIYGLPVFLTGKDAYAVASFSLPGDQTGSSKDVSLVVMTHDGGNTWSTPVSGLLDNPAWRLNLNMVSPWDGFAHCGDRLCVTHDGAQTWAPVLSNLSFAASTGENGLADLDFISLTTGWAILNENSGFVLYKTTDGGQTWRGLDVKIEP